MPLPKGYIFSLETRAKLSKAGKGRKFTDEHKRKIGLANKGKKKPPFTAEHLKKMGDSHRGKKHSPEAIAKMRIAQSNRPPEYGLAVSARQLGKKQSEETKQKISETRIRLGLGRKSNTIGLRQISGDGNPAKQPEVRKKISESKMGNKNPNWKDGISLANALIRASAEYREWRNNVLKRDKYTCIWCGLVMGQWLKEEKRKVFIEADHIKPFAYFPELRFELSNGRALCRECHKNTETYGFHK